MRNFCIKKSTCINEQDQKSIDLAERQTKRQRQKEKKRIKKTKEKKT